MTQPTKRQKKIHRNNSLRIHNLPLPDTVSYYSLPGTTQPTGAPPITRCQREGGERRCTLLQDDLDSCLTQTTYVQV